MSKKPTKKQIQYEVRVRRMLKIAAAVTAVSFLFMAYALFKTQVLPGKYLGGFFLVSTLSTAAVVYLQFAQRLNLKKSVVLGIISAVMILANIGIFTVGTVTSSFIGSIQARTQSTEEYSIVAIKARKTMLDAPNQSMALLAADTQNEAVKPAAAEKTGATARDYDDPTTAILALQNNDVQLAVFKSSYIQLLKEINNNELYLQLEVLATFTVKTTATTDTANADVSKPFILYISGIDTYGAISEVSRSDVNIIAVVNPRTHKILLVNTPRDYYVQLHGTTGRKDKLTHAGIYGVDTSVKTLEDLYGVDISYNIRINFSSLVKVVDTLGGVDVYSEYDFSSDGHNFTVGNNHLNGEQTLAFSRNRYSFDGGDRTRGENQLRVIRAIITKLSTASTVVRYQQVLGSIQGAFQTNMSSDAITTLARNQLDDMAKWDTVSISVDGTGATDYTYSTGSAQLYVMVPDQATVDAAKQKIRQYLSQ